MEKLVTIAEQLTSENLSAVTALAQKLRTRELKPQVSEGERLGLYPIKDKVAWQHYQNQRAMMWPASEVDFSEKDKAQFNDPKIITPRQRELFTFILGFFMPADGAIIENVNALLQDVETMEEYMFLAAQMYIETQHAEGYNNAAKEFFTSAQEFHQVKRMIDDSPLHRQKLSFMQKYSNSDEDRIIRLAASACMEGIFFMGLFPIIFYFIKFEKLPKFTQLNEQIFKDESEHCDFYCDRVNGLLSELPDEEVAKYRVRITEVVQEAVNIEREFVSFMLKEPVTDKESDEIMGMTGPNLATFIEMVADQTILRMGLPKIYNSYIELSWAAGCAMALKTNKYEKDVTSYLHTAPKGETSARSKKSHKRY